MAVRSLASFGTADVFVSNAEIFIESLPEDHQDRVEVARSPPAGERLETGPDIPAVNSLSGLAPMCSRSGVRASW
jgi:hypothetical protein